jgi:hypothetical protein
MRKNREKRGGRERINALDHAVNSSAPSSFSYHSYINLTVAETVLQLPFS